MAKKKAKKVNKSVKRPVAKRTTQARPRKSIGLAIISLILNVLILPGFGSLIAGRIRTGIWQIVLFLVGAFFVAVAIIYQSAYYLLVLGLLCIAALIWAIVTSVNLIREAE